MLCVGELQRGAKSPCALQLEREENHMEKSLWKRKTNDSGDSWAAHVAQQQISVWELCAESVE